MKICAKGQLVDLRKKEEFEEGHINGARNIPFVMLTLVIQDDYVKTYLFTYIVKKEKLVNRAALVSLWKRDTNKFINLMVD